MTRFRWGMNTRNKVPIVTQFKCNLLFKKSKEEEYPDLYGQDFETTRELCLSSGELFVDKVFPPNESSISALLGREESSLSEEEADMLADHKEHVQGMEWIRASKMVQDPKFLVEGPTRFDINQGEIGNCWFLAAAANMTLIPEIRSKVIPSDQGFGEENKYAGIFHFR